ncbi:bifunctional cobalt-precorrin-7 (C(5))-methyltransferase/cobalt-precorrin-6B (C(15))-methyltransferase [Nonomuraea longicatena]|uniref:Precorrin-6y C5,15-methyltransferase (Decarboxylating) subunit CbiE n=1 Tax=Nonomuraea longicatena TaxID=83682 RepID=A0ABP3Z7F0_9ACTN
MSITVIGRDGPELPSSAAARLRAAALVVGPAPASEIVQAIDDHLEQGEGPAVVLADGDPGLFGAVRALRERGIRPEVIPAAPLVTRAFAKAGLNWEDALIVAPAGAHRLARAVNACRAHPKVAVLCADGVGPAELARQLAPTTPRALIVCEDLGGPGERVTHSRLGEATTRPWRDPDVVIVLDPLHRSEEPVWLAGAQPGPPEWALPFATGLPPEVRAFVLARLGPRVGDLIWDVGAGHGEIAVECARLGAAVFAVERDHDRCAALRANVLRHAVKVALTRGLAPPALEPLPDPDAVYVGGGGPEVIAACAARRPRALVCALPDPEAARAALAMLAGLGHPAQATRIQAARLLPEGGEEAADPVFVVHARAG